MGIKRLPEIRTNLWRAESWVHGAGQHLLEPTFSDSLEGSKRAAQEAKKLIDEAIVDLDGLIQDAKNEADGIDPEYEAWQAARCGGCPQCGDDGEA